MYEDKAGLISLNRSLILDYKTSDLVSKVIDTVGEQSIFQITILLCQPYAEITSSIAQYHFQHHDGSLIGTMILFTGLIDQKAKI